MSAKASEPTRDPESDRLLLLDQIVLITGASRGVGRATALRLALARPRHIVVGYCTDHDAARTTVAEIKARGVDASAIATDVGRVELLEDLFAGISERFGRLDVFVSNAARGGFGPVSELSPRSFTKTMDLNARAFLVGCQLAAGLMGERGGRIVGLSSLGAHRYTPGYAALGAAKASLETLARYLAVELAPKKINVNVVCGGLIDTASSRAHPDHDRLFREVAARTPAGRVGRVEDLAGIVAFLCGPDADWIRGQTLVADGGYSLLL
jgi:enoyl-[acyl-carrier protein] reductase III